MNSRERVLKAINHQEPDRVPIDLGGSIVTGIMAGALARLRAHLGLNGRVKVYDVFQMLGEVTDDIIERFDIDVLPVEPETISFEHIHNRDYKPWTLFDGTEVLMPGDFEITVSPEGDWLIHEDGDPEKPVIARMPEDGYYFDIMAHTTWDPNFQPTDIDTLRGSDWGRVKDETLRYLQGKAETLRQAGDKALIMSPWTGGGVLGAPVIGSIPEWLVLLASEPDYVGEFFALATERALENLARYWEAVGEDIDIIQLDGHDFGAQNAELFSPAVFKRHYVPCYKAQCDWIHENTPWKVGKHCCGSIPNLMEDIIESGIDLLTPVQTSAQGMDPQWLKDNFGDRITFWGGGVDTQRVLPFGTPEEVRAQVIERLRIFAPGGGFLWNGIHNIQYTVPPENIVAALDAVREFGRYPVQ